jgi:hypothetical protein
MQQTNKKKTTRLLGQRMPVGNESTKHCLELLLSAAQKKEYNVSAGTS